MLLTWSHRFTVQAVLDRRDGCDALELASADAQSGAASGSWGGGTMTPAGGSGGGGSGGSAVAGQPRISRRLETGLPPGSVVYVASVASLVVLNDAVGKRVALYTVRVQQTRPTTAEWTCRRRFVSPHLAVVVEGNERVTVNDVIHKAINDDVDCVNGIFSFLRCTF